MRVIDQALTEVFADVRAVMRSINVARLSLPGFVCIDVDCRQELMNAVEGLEVL